MATRIYKGKTLNGECLEITVNGKLIIKAEKNIDDQKLPYLLPVLVDLQHNGALGVEFNKISEVSNEQLNRVFDHMRSHGVGRCLASFATKNIDILSASMASLDKRLKASEELSKLYPGFFQEGVFISPEPGWRGAHQIQFIKEPDFNLFLKLWNASGKRIKVVNVAPEMPGAIEFIEKAVAIGIKVAIGHCKPDSEIISKAVEAGATMITHFGNGAKPEIPRLKNPFWAMLAEDNLAPGLVGYGFHLTPEIVKVALKCKGENAFMVSDSIFFAGVESGEYTRSDGSKVKVTAEGKIQTLINPDILGDAWSQLDKSVEFLAGQCEVDFIEAWKLCSIYPVKIAGIKMRRGSKLCRCQVAK